VRRYFREVMGVDMPKSVRTWRRFFRPLDSSETMQKDDLIIMMGANRYNLADHLAIAFSPSEIMHASSACNGIICTRVERHQHTVLAVWRLKETL
jgi:hypothetical protein